MAPSKKPGPFDHADDAGDEIGSVDHDLRNVLSAIRGFATVVGEELRPSDPARDDIEQILKAVDRGVTVLRRLSALRPRGSAAPTPSRASPAPVEVNF